MGSSDLGDDFRGEASRPDGEWINVEPTPTKSEPWYNTSAREIMNTPLHGDKSVGATDLDYWGATDFDSVRHDQKPAFVRNYNATELNGKEINRPAEEYFGDWGPQQPGDERVDWAGGSFTGFTPDVRLQGRNRYHRFVTFRDPERPGFGDPIVTGGAGAGKPPEPAEINFGNRVIRIFADIWLNATGAAKRSAPPALADITLPGGTRRNSELLQITGDASAHAGGTFGGMSANPVKGGRMGLKLPWSFRTQFDKAHGGSGYGGMDANPVKGGRDSRRLPWSFRTQFDKAHGGSGYGGMAANPVKGGRESHLLPWSYRTQYEKAHGGGGYGGMGANPVAGGRDSRLFPWEFRVGVEGSHGGGSYGGINLNPVKGGGMRRNPQQIWDTMGPAGTLGGTASGQDLALNPVAGYHGTKMPEETPGYVGPKGGISGFGGEGAVGTVDPLRRTNTFPYPMRMGGGSAGKGEVRSEQRVRGNMVLGLRGGDVSNEPPARMPSQVTQTALYRNIVAARSEESLGDLFDVQHG
jgi:hypothetical protein